MNKKVQLQSLVKNLQESVKNVDMTKDVISKAVQQLSNIGHDYKADTFPDLGNTESFHYENGETPQNLAEALLWKLGKWKSYRKFVQQYANDEPKPSNTDVVFYAFARHLKDKNNPIYDQHAIRAMWAISIGFNSDEGRKCKDLLLDKKGVWKDTGTGGTAVDCYTIFLNHINKMNNAGASKREIDRLLMPLGQALKKFSENYDALHQLCGWTVVS